MQFRFELSYDAPPVTAAQDVVSAVVSLTPLRSGMDAEHGVSTAWLEGDR